MQVGIFGDSFAAPKNTHPAGANGSTWFEYLSGHHDVITYGKNGASLFYSMVLFLSNHHTFDRNIFTITNPHRFVIPDPEQVLPAHMRFMCGLQSVEIFNEQVESSSWKNKKEILKIIDHARNFIIHIQDEQYNEYTHRLIVDEIVRIRPDTLIVPCFYESSRTITGTLPLVEITNVENKAWGITAKKYSELMLNHIDTRPTHCSDENNSMLADKINACLCFDRAFELKQEDIILPNSPASRYIIALNT